MQSHLLPCLGAFPLTGLWVPREGRPERQTRALGGQGAIRRQSPPSGGWSLGPTLMPIMHPVPRGSPHPPGQPQGPAGLISLHPHQLTCKLDP